MGAGHPGPVNTGRQGDDMDPWVWLAAFFWGLKDPLIRYRMGPSSYVCGFIKHNKPYYSYIYHKSTYKASYLRGPILFRAPKNRFVSRGSAPRLSGLRRQDRHNLSVCLLFSQRANAIRDKVRQLRPGLAAAMFWPRNPPDYFGADHGANMDGARLTQKSDQGWSRIIYPLVN